MKHSRVSIAGDSVHVAMDSVTNWISKTLNQTDSTIQSLSRVHRTQHFRFRELDLDLINRKNVYLEGFIRE